MPQIGQPPGEMSDKALNNAVILDTEDDVYSKFFIECSKCGNSLTVKDVREEPELGIILETTPCDTCNESAHNKGYWSAIDSHSYKQGF